MDSFTDLLNKWPNISELADDHGVPYSTAAAWKARDSLPASYWGATLSAALERGYTDITIDLLLSLSKRKPQVEAAHG